MEVDPTAAAEKLSELLAILALALISMALGLTIGFVIYLAWKSNYLRDLIRLLLTSVQHGIEGTTEPPSLFPWTFMKAALTTVMMTQLLLSQDQEEPGSSAKSAVPESSCPN